MEQESVARLMKAEMDAKKEVDDAKKERDILLKAADDEAAAMIEETKASRQREYDDVVAKSQSGDTKATSALEGAMQQQIAKLLSKAQQNKGAVMSMLTQSVQEVNTTCR